MSVVALKTEADTVIEDLERFIEQIRAGEVSPTTVLLITRDRVNERIGTGVCGEQLAFSHAMGVLAYAQAKYFEEARS